MVFFLMKSNLQAEALQRLRRLFDAEKTGTYDFLGFTLNLEEGTLTDNLGVNPWSELIIRLIPVMLQHYTEGKQTPLTGKLVKFRDIPGGYAYEGAFINRAIKPVEGVFGENPKMLLEAAKRLGGKPLSQGDASVEIVALKGIPLTIILYGAGEFGASASLLYDESASKYLPTEDLAVLGEITASRLIQAKALG